jgi:type IV pilus assembly protein PilE
MELQEIVKMDSIFRGGIKKQVTRSKGLKKSLLLKGIIQMTAIKNKKLKGFTLAEIMVVLALIGILISVALPKLLPLISKAKSIEAQMQLKHVMSLEKAFFFMNSKYTSNLTELGFEQPTLVSDGGSANYKIEVVEANNKGFVAKATSITDFDSDGTMDVWQVDQTDAIKETTPD